MSELTSQPNQADRSDSTALGADERGATPTAVAGRLVARALATYRLAIAFEASWPVGAVRGLRRCNRSCTAER